MYCLKKEEKTKRLNNSRNISYRTKRKMRLSIASPRFSLLGNAGEVTSSVRNAIFVSDDCEMRVFLNDSREFNVNHVLASLKASCRNEVWCRKFLRVGTRRYFRSKASPHAHDICAITKNIKRKPTPVFLYAQTWRHSTIPPRLKPFGVRNWKNSRMFTNIWLRIWCGKAGRNIILLSKFFSQQKIKQNPEESQKATPKAIYTRKVNKKYHYL